ncbi:hypothetical protein ABPG75_003708 [Micractinium tetrahymenae]
MPPVRDSRSSDVRTGLILLLISQLRLHHTAARTNDGAFHILSLLFSTCAALPVALHLLRRTRSFYTRHRTPLLLSLRLAMTALVVAPHAVPEGPHGGQCSVSAVWDLLLNSHALTAAFLSLGFQLPFNTHIWAAAGQQVLLLLTAVGRCGYPTAAAGLPSSQTFLDILPADCTAALSSLLDWPIHLVAPGVATGGSALSPRAACLACTLWLQQVLGGLLPILALWWHSGSEAERRHTRAGRLLAAGIGDMPGLCGAWLAHMAWLVLRTTAAVALPVQG